MFNEPLSNGYFNPWALGVGNVPVVCSPATLGQLHAAIATEFLAKLSDEYSKARGHGLPSTASVPPVSFGDTEPLMNFMTQNQSEWQDDIKSYLNSFQSYSPGGVSLAFFNYDMNWGDQWIPAAASFTSFIRTPIAGYAYTPPQVGVIFDGILPPICFNSQSSGSNCMSQTGGSAPNYDNGSVWNNAAVVASAEAGMQYYFNSAASTGGCPPGAASPCPPDNVVFQSWLNSPSRNLPESDPTSFTFLVDYFFDVIGKYSDNLPPFPLYRLCTNAASACNSGVSSYASATYSYQNNVSSVDSMTSSGWISEFPLGNVYNSQGSSPSSAYKLTPLYEFTNSQNGTTYLTTNPSDAVALSAPYNTIPKTQQGWVFPSSDVCNLAGYISGSAAQSPCANVANIPVAEVSKGTSPNIEFYYTQDPGELSSLMENGWIVVANPAFYTAALFPVVLPGAPIAISSGLDLNSNGGGIEFKNNTTIVLNSATGQVDVANGSIDLNFGASSPGNYCSFPDIAELGCQATFLMDGSSHDSYMIGASPAYMGAGGIIYNAIPKNGIAPFAGALTVSGTSPFLSIYSTANQLMWQPKPQ